MRSLRTAFEDQTVDGGAIDVPSTINAKDHHVVGAALLAEATIIVTNDRRLRTEIGTSDLGLHPVDIDTFAMELWDSSPTGVATVVDAMTAKRVRRAVSMTEMLASIARHMPGLAAELARR